MEAPQYEDSTSFSGGGGDGRGQDQPPDQHLHILPDGRTVGSHEWFSNDWSSDVWSCRHWNKWDMFLETAVAMHESLCNVVWHYFCE